VTSPEPEGLEPEPDRNLDRQRHTRASRWAARLVGYLRPANGADALVRGRAVLARWLELARQRPRQVVVGAAATGVAVAALIGFVSCGGSGPVSGPVAAVPTFFTAPPAEPSGPLFPSPTSTRATDGCHGLISAAAVSQAAGFPVSGSAGDAAAAVTGYADAVRAQGLTATVRLCPFAGSTGDQVYVLALTFADAAQATRMYANGQVGQAGSVPVPGVGDAAATDGVTTLLTRRGRNVVLVFLIRPRQPTANHAGALRSVALAALART
jgi:hypothetical protein